MTNIQNNKYNLEERTISFSEDLVKFCKKLPGSEVVSPLLNQLIRSGTSIGANYTEANGASSKKDFKNKISIAKKEAKETQYWLRILAGAIDSETLKNDCRTLWQEAKELSLIFSKIVINTK